ncbi:hypothetical protein SAMN05421538_10279 [Paracoccus isoporae]|uniref:Peptidase propeptide and YPEB domain-containing protein n=1 Tax=Paracoccus isoporae TaxID=591205 RepID=A0A1G6WA97_9RHOB|nr:hypothetical protein [Paracoccus isoporae]SDD62719.1 hypothetical protein SAMN05421538_10279 [Paracoccus isoporae]
MTYPTLLTLALAAAALPVAAHASSPDAWEEFRTQTQERCLSALDAPLREEAEIEVNPFGSESYGVALLTVPLPDEGSERIVCIHDKQDGSVELTAPFDPPVAGQR